MICVIQYENEGYLNILFVWSLFYFILFFKGKPQGAQLYYKRAKSSKNWTREEASKGSQDLRGQSKTLGRKRRAHTSHPPCETQWPTYQEVWSVPFFQHKKDWSKEVIRWKMDCFSKNNCWPWKFVQCDHVVTFSRTQKESLKLGMSQAKKYLKNNIL